MAAPRVPNTQPGFIRPGSSMNSCLGGRDSGIPPSYRPHLASIKHPVTLARLAGSHERMICSASAKVSKYFADGQSAGYAGPSWESRILLTSADRSYDWSMKFRRTSLSAAESARPTALPMASVSSINRGSSERPRHTARHTLPKIGSYVRHMTLSSTTSTRCSAAKTLSRNAASASRSNAGTGPSLARITGVRRLKLYRDLCRAMSVSAT